MMIKITALVVMLTLLSFASKADDLIVVANTNMPDVTVEKRQIRDIFMGNNSQLLLKPVALSPNSEARFIFNTKIVGLTESRIQSYWAQMRFSGRKKPPQEFDSIESIIAFLKNNKDTVAYLPSETEIPDELVVIYHTD